MGKSSPACEAAAHLHAFCTTFVVEAASCTKWPKSGLHGSGVDKHTATSRPLRVSSSPARCLQTYGNSSKFVWAWHHFVVVAALMYEVTQQRGPRRMEVNGCKFIVGEATQNRDRHSGRTPDSGVTALWYISIRRQAMVHQLLRGRPRRIYIECARDQSQPWSVLATSRKWRHKDHTPCHDYHAYVVDASCRVNLCFLFVGLCSGERSRSASDLRPTKVFASPSYVKYQAAQHETRWHRRGACCAGEPQTGFGYAILMASVGQYARGGA